MTTKPDIITAYITDYEIEKRVKELGDQISVDYANQDLTIICVLKGAYIFCADLVRNIRRARCKVEFVQLSSYGTGTVSSGRVDLIKAVDNLSADTHVLIVEDIVDTGRTLKHLLDTVQTFNPKSVKSCALLNKPSRREVADIKADYIGFTIPNVFVVGYGLDKAEQHRGLPFIGRVEDTPLGKILNPFRNFVTHGQAKTANAINRFAEQVREAAHNLRHPQQ